MLVIQIWQREAAGCLRGNVKVQHFAKDTYTTFITCIVIISHFIINCSFNCLLYKLNLILGALSIGKSTTCNGFGTLPQRSWDMFLWMTGDFCTSCRGIPGGRIGSRRFFGVKLWMLRLLYPISLWNSSYVQRRVAKWKPQHFWFIRETASGKAQFRRVPDMDHFQ